MRWWVLSADSSPCSGGSKPASSAGEPAPHMLCFAQVRECSPVLGNHGLLGALALRKRGPHVPSSSR